MLPRAFGLPEDMIHRSILDYKSKVFLTMISKRFVKIGIIV